MPQKDNLTEFRHAVQAAESYYQSEYSWRVAEAASVINHFMNRYGDAGFVSMDAIAHAYLLTYHQNHPDGSLDDCVEQFTNAI